MNQLKTGLRWLFSALMIAAGVNHFMSPDFYVGIMPPWLVPDWHLELVWASGVVEVLVGVAIAVRACAPYSGWAAVLLLVAVFPANVHMALNPELFPDVAPWLLYLRLPIQVLLGAWALWVTPTKGARPH